MILKNKQINIVEEILDSISGNLSMIDGCKRSMFVWTVN